jgi:hypothetical protein
MSLFDPEACVKFSQHRTFYDESLSTLHPNCRLDKSPLSVVHSYTFNIFVAILHTVSVTKGCDIPCRQGIQLTLFPMACTGTIVFLTCSVLMAVARDETCMSLNPMPVISAIFLKKLVISMSGKKGSGTPFRLSNFRKGEGVPSQKYPCL